MSTQLVVLLFLCIDRAAALSMCSTRPPRHALIARRRARASATEAATEAPPQFDPQLFAEYANPERFEGSDMSVTEYPSPILRAANAEVTAFDSELQAMCAQLFAVMYEANGCGLAAPQVGLNLQLFVYNPDPTVPGALKKLGERIVANPRIVQYCGGTNVEIEGCLSSRGECCTGEICRAKELQVEYQDERGRLKRKKLRGFEARVFQHEYDHLQGVLHFDRQSPADRRRIQPFLDVLVEQHGPGGALELPPGVAAGLQPPPRTDADPVEFRALSVADRLTAKAAARSDAASGGAAAAAKSSGASGASQSAAAKAAGFGTPPRGGTKKPKQKKKR